MSSNLIVPDYLQIAKSLDNISNDLKDSIKIAFDPLLLPDLNRFRHSVEQKMNDVVCTPSKDEAIDEIQRFLDEELPVTFQTANKTQDKELHTTMASKPYQGSTTLVTGNSKYFNDICSVTLPCSKFETPPPIIRREIYAYYKNFMELLNYDKDNIKIKVTDNNNALQKIEKFIEDMKKMDNIIKDEVCRDAFTVQQEEKIIKIGNLISQFVFIQDNKDLLEDFTSIVEEMRNNEDLDMIMSTVNDLLQQITL